MSEKERLRAMKDAFATTKRRCYSESCPDYKYYGGRGITICDRWLESFDNYLADMGLRPEGMTLERVDNDGPYSPENCIWASRAVQGNNTRQVKRISYKGKTQTVSEWERELGWKAGTLKARLGPLNYTVDEAFTKPIRCGGLLPGRTYNRRKQQDFSKVKRGLDNPNTVFSAEEIVEIRILGDAGLSRSLIARAYGVTTTTISKVIDKKGAYCA